MKVDQDYREEIFFEQFIKLWSDYPIDSESEKTETPDFIITTRNSGKIGIEITELINSKKIDEKFHITEKFSLENKIVRKTFDLYTRKCKVPIGVRMSFLDNFECHKKEIKLIAEKLCDIILNEVQNFDLIQINKFSKREGLPKQLIELSITFFPEITETLWYPTQGGFLPNIDNNDVIKLIQKKEKLLLKYKEKVDEIYLLIVEGNPPISWFHKFVDWESEVFSSGFDKVFLLRRLRRKLYNLI